MAIKVQGTTVIDDGRNINNIGVATVGTLDVNKISPDGSDFGQANYVLTSGGPSGNISWKLVTNVGAGILDAVFIKQDGSNVGAGTATTFDFYENFSVTQPSSGIASVRLADTLNLGGLNVTGVSTFQGNVNLGDNDSLYFGDSNDLRISHDGSNSVIRELGSGNLYFTSNGAGIILQKDAGNENLARFLNDGSVELYYDNSKKFETTDAGVTISGIATATTFYAPGGTFAASSESKTNSSIVIDENSAIYTLDNSATNLRVLIEKNSNIINIGQFNTALIDGIELKPGVSGTVKLHHGGVADNVKLQTTTSGIEVTGTTDTDQLNVTGVSTFDGNVYLGDDDRLYFGDNGDLVITHNGSKSIINEVGLGGLVIGASSTIDLMNPGGTEYYARFNDNGAVELYYDNFKKFETTDYGIYVTGAGNTSTIGGAANLVLDPTTVGDNTGTVTILGNLQVEGTQTIINSTTLEVDDKLVSIAKNATNATQADGAGLEINGASATLTYASTGDKWVFNKAPYYNTDRLLTTADEGSGNGLDADTLDSIDSASFLRSDVDDTMSGRLLINGQTSTIAGGTFSNGWLQIGTSSLGWAFDNNEFITFGDVILGSASGSTLTFTNIPAFDGGTSGSTAPFTVDSNTVVQNLNADLLDGIQGASFLRSDTADTASGLITFSSGINITNSTIGMGNDSAILFFNDSTNQTRTGYWTNKDGFEVRGDSNSKLNVVLQTGNLEIDQNAYIEGILGIGGGLTGTASQKLQVTGGAYVSGDVGINSTAPTAKLDVNGDVSIASTVSIGTTIDIVPYNNLGTLSFEGSAGQLFSITNNLTSGSIFSVNDVSGIPSIDVDADGTVIIAPYGSTEYVGIGLTNPSEKLDVSGNIKVSGDVKGITDTYIISCSDETLNLSAGTGKVTFRMPISGTLTSVKATVSTAPTGSSIIVDINESGTSVLSTKLSIDAGEKTSTTAATPAVISDSSLNNDSEISIDIDQVGSTVPGKGLKVYLYIKRN